MAKGRLSPRNSRCIIRNSQINIHFSFNKILLHHTCAWKVQKRHLQSLYGGPKSYGNSHDFYMEYKYGRLLLIHDAQARKEGCG